jgi:hypothetical protein
LIRPAANPLDTEYVAELERIVERTRRELETLARDIAKPSEEWPRLASGRTLSPGRRPAETDRAVGSPAL